MDAEREGLALGNEARHPEAPSRQGPELRGDRRRMVSGLDEAQKNAALVGEGTAWAQR
jgi:hypothetical protein